MIEKGEWKMKRKTIRRGVTYFLLALFSFVMAYPIVWWFFASFKHTYDLADRSLWPTEWTLENYREGWTMGGLTFTTFYKNTIFITLMNVIGTIITAGLVAYGFGRLNFKGKNIWFAILMITMMLPSQVTVISQYIMYNKLNLTDTYVPLILPHWCGGGAFFVFLLVQFVRGVPRDLDEAAKIDGCGRWRIYWRILFPIMKPAFVTAGIYSFIWSWDDFYSQMLYINSSSKFTVSLGLRMFIDQADIKWGPLLAMSLLSVIPSLVIFFINQKEFVEGVATTGLKG